MGCGDELYVLCLFEEWWAIHEYIHIYIQVFKCSSLQLLAGGTEVGEGKKREDDVLLAGNYTTKK